MDANSQLINKEKLRIIADQYDFSSWRRNGFNFKATKHHVNELNDQQMKQIAAFCYKNGKQNIFNIMKEQYSNGQMIIIIEEQQNDIAGMLMFEVEKFTRESKKELSLDHITNHSSLKQELKNLGFMSNSNQDEWVASVSDIIQTLYYIRVSNFDTIAAPDVPSESDSGSDLDMEEGEQMLLFGEERLEYLLKKNLERLVNATDDKLANQISEISSWIITRTSDLYVETQLSELLENGPSLNLKVLSISIEKKFAMYALTRGMLRYLSTIANDLTTNEKIQNTFITITPDKEQREMYEAFRFTTSYISDDGDTMISPNLALDQYALDIYY